MKRTLLTLSTIALVMVFVTSMALAGTTVIHVETETGGDIDAGLNSQWDNNYENVNGAMFWNGSGWGVNDTYGHMYFTDLRTGEKLKDFNQTVIDHTLTSSSDITDLWAAYSAQLDQYTADVDYYNNVALPAYNAALAAYDPTSGDPPPTPPTVPVQPDPPFSGQNLYAEDSYTEYVPGPNGMMYEITKAVYTYSIGENGGAGGQYAYQAVEYTVQLVDENTLAPSGPKVVLKSRGSGQGDSDDTAYFNCYIQNEDGSTEAMRGDPVWFHYNQGIDTAKDNMDGLSSANVKGNLPTVSSQYWMDVDGGSEMGGKTFKMLTGNIGTPNTTNLGSAFPTGFSIQYTDAAGNLQEIILTPDIIQENYIPPPPPDPPSPPNPPSCCC